MTCAPCEDGDIMQRLRTMEAGVASMGLELEVLRDCLIASGACSLDFYQARLHRSRFNAVRQLERSDPDAGCREVYSALEQTGLLLPIVQFSGLASVRSLEQTSRQVSSALRRLLNPIRASFTKLYVCGGCQRSTVLARGSLGGRPESTGKTVERLDLGRHVGSMSLPSWEVMPQLPEQRSDALIAVLRGDLYVCGGQDGLTILSSAARFRPCQAEWEVLPSLLEGRRDAAGASLHGCLYVCGGCCSSSPLSSAERFNPELYAWEALPNMSRHRSGSASAVLGGALYMAGGGDGQQPLSSAERLVEGRWEVLPAMSHRRIRAASGVLAERWLVCGGGDGRYVLNSAELLDPSRLFWERVAPMATPRWCSLAGAVHGCLYVCGGGDGGS
ncbi:unnamed protein product, partial [Effrenium voratum]